MGSQYNGDQVSNQVIKKVNQVIKLNILYV